MDFIARALEERYSVTAVALFVIGMMNLLHQRDLVRKVIGFNIMDAAIFLLLASRGYVSGRAAPIVAEKVGAAAAYVNPIPTGLVLTGIVVSVSVSAFSLALIQRIYRKYGSTDIRELVFLVKRED